MKVFGLAGWSGSGKTTLMVNLLPEIISRGLTVSTVKHAHEINFLDEGRIMEKGTYEELMVLNGRFAEFARRQEVADTANTL